MENSTPQMAPKSNMKGLLIGIMVFLLILVIGGIVYLGQNGMFLKGSIQDLTSNISGGPIYYLKQNGWACTNQASGYGSIECPFQTLPEAAQYSAQSSYDQVEIHITGGNYFFPTGSTISFNNKSKFIIIGGYSDFSKVPNPDNKTIFSEYGRLEFNNVSAVIRNLQFENIDVGSSDFIKIDNRNNDVATIEFSNIKMNKINAGSIIRYVHDTANAQATFSNITITECIAINDSIIDIEGPSRVKMFNNSIFFSNAKNAIIRASKNIDIYNNLIANTGYNTSFQQLPSPKAAIWIEDGENTHIANNTLATNRATEGVIYQNGTAKMDLVGNLISNLDKPFKVSTASQSNALSNGWYINDNDNVELNTTYNITCNPKFAQSVSNTSPEWYKLSSETQCKDLGGDPEWVKNNVKTDFFGTSRPQGSNYDIGFHEYLPIAFEFAPLATEQFKFPAETTTTTVDSAITDNLKITDAIKDLAPLTSSVCGNSQVETGEDCDDGNIIDGDGCSKLCKIEPPIQFVCGDGIKAGNEECDDNNTINGDGCSSICTTEQQTETDLCPNIAGIQTSVPSGYTLQNSECKEIVTSTTQENVCGEWSDVSKNDAEYDIWVYLCDRGIMMGSDDNTFRPEDKLTRAELLALAFRASDYENEYQLDEGASYCFLDVNDEWFASYICTGNDLGFAKGYAGNLFKPGQNVILAEGLKLFLGALNEPYSINSDPNKWYYDMLQDASAKKYLPYTLTSESVVGPIELTRRKAANMLYRILIYR